MSAGRISIFLTVVLSIWAVIHLYVFWRASSIPWLITHLSRRTLIFAGVILWASYPIARTLNAWITGPIPWSIEFAATTWIGVAFLMFAAFLFVDVITLGGFLLPKLSPLIRGWAVIVALGLSIIGLAQGQRLPIVRDYEVQLPGLPKERDGLVLVQVSDLHLGTLIGPAWMERLIRRVNDLKPDVIVAVGDVVDAEADRLQRMLPVLQKLRAPLGVWAVTGNHEFYAGLDRSVHLMQEAGYTVLRDRSAQVIPGLVFAGVDDLGSRHQFGVANNAVQKALTNRAPGAVIYLCHTPEQAEAAAAAGAGLMLSGHTHEGQLWPFTYLVRLRYALLAGRYEVNGMPVIVCRGTGTWGPRMRLWRPSEIVRIKLRTPA